MTAIVEDLLVGATSLASFGVIEDLGGIYAIGGRRGSNYVVPGLDGEIQVTKPRAAFPVTVGLVLFGTDPTTGAELTTDDARTRAFNQKWLNLVALVDTTSGLLTLTRKLSLPGVVTQSKTCNAELVGGMEPGLLGLTDGRCVLNFVNLDGKWT